MYGSQASLTLQSSESLSGFRYSLGAGHVARVLCRLEVGLGQLLHQSRAIKFPQALHTLSPITSASIDPSPSLTFRDSCPPPPLLPGFPPSLWPKKEDIKHMRSCCIVFWGLSRMSFPGFCLEDEGGLAATANGSKTHPNMSSSRELNRATD